MMINPAFANPILTIANVLTERNIPHSINVILDGLQVCFPWNCGDIVCHSYSYGHNCGLVESIGCPWDDDDVSCICVDQAINRIINWYADYK